MDIAALLAEMAVRLHGTSTSLESLGEIAQYARTAVRGDEAGVMLVGSKGEISTPAETSPLMTQAHALQAEFDEGPCLEAMRDGDKSYNVFDTRQDPRWPHWGQACASLGFLSVISVRLEVDSRRYGSLNVYASVAGAFDEEDMAVIDILSRHASVGVASTRTTEELKVALDSRTIIGQAQGMLMNFYQIDADAAFTYLQRLSQDQNIKLVDIARHLVEHWMTLHATTD